MRFQRLNFWVEQHPQWNQYGFNRYINHEDWYPGALFLHSMPSVFWREEYVGTYVYLNVVAKLADVVSYPACSTYMSFALSRKTLHSILSPD